MNHLQNVQIQIPQLQIPSRPQSAASVTSRVSVDHNQKGLLKKYAKKQTIEDCMNSLDLFTNMMKQSQQQRRKLRRDVQKYLRIQIYNQDQIVYDIGQVAIKLFLIIEGSVSVLIPKNNPQKLLFNTEHFDIQNYNQQVQYQQVSVYQQGRGFGQGQFISRRRRQVRVACKSQTLVVGVLLLDAFKQVVQNYRLRVYYKKRDQYQQCLFFQHLSDEKLQFVINNSKAIKLKKGQVLFKENSKVKNLYFLTKGQLKLFKKHKKVYEGQSYKNIAFSKKYFTHLKNNKHQIIIGTLQKENFIGDMELAMNKNYEFSAACQSLQAEMYACDTRIVMNQISQELLQKLSIIYQYKNKFYQNRVQNNLSVKKRYQSQHQDFLKPQLTKVQLQKRRKLKRKYVQKYPSVIGSSSASDIEKLILKKRNLLSPQAKSLQFPIVSVFLSHSSKKRQHSPKFSSSLPMVKIPKIKSQNSLKKLNYGIQENVSKIKQSQSMIIKLRPLPKKFKLQINQRNIYVQNLKKIIREPIENPQMKQINQAIKKMRGKLLCNQMI